MPCTEGTSHGPPAATWTIVLDAQKSLFSGLDLATALRTRDSERAISLSSGVRWLAGVWFDASAGRVPRTTAGLAGVGAVVLYPLDRQAPNRGDVRLSVEPGFAVSAPVLER